VLPLNVVPVETLGVQKERDTAGGLGGREGRGTLPRVPTGREGEQAATNVRRLPNRSSDLPLMMRAGGRRNWQHVRDRVVGGQSQALQRRLRGVLKGESDRLRSLISAPDRTPRETDRLRAQTLGEDDIATVMSMSSFELREAMRVQVGAAGTNGFRLAVQLIDGIEADPEVPTDIELAVRTRVAEARMGRLQELREEHFPRAAALFRAIGQAWEEFGNDVLAITESEVAYAFDRAAARGWDSKGFRVMGIQVRCEDHADMVGKRFAITDVPTPLRLGCRCFTLPAEIAE
jgi:hypothetical protein